ncbi:MAG: hypothetical protein ACREV4_14010 [Gammaproteobacteria bacterium]
MDADKRWLRTTTLLLGAVLVTGCATTSGLIPFTHDLRHVHGLNNEDLMKLQYYLAEPIVLYRSDVSGGSTVTDGRLITQGDSVVDEIVVNEGTPGIAIDAGETWVVISFEQGASALPFSSDEARRAEWSGIYSLSSSDWNNGIGTVEYDGKSYSAIRDSGFAYLLIDKESLSKVVKNKRSLEGRLLGASQSP